MECPVCKQMHPRDHPSCNLAREKLCEAYLEDGHQRASKRQRTSTGSDILCTLHAEKLEQFCGDCKALVCAVCLHSEKHKCHRFQTIYAAAKDRRRIIGNALINKLKTFNKCKTICEQSAEHVKVQTQNTERQIKEQFKKLHQFLKEEEEASINANALEEDELSIRVT